MSGEPLLVTLELVRAEEDGDPYAFRFGRQQYRLRSEGGAYGAATLEWTPELLDDLEALRELRPDPSRVQRLGEVLRAFLKPAGWARYEEKIAEAASRGQPVVVTFLSAAAELYALPWDLLTVGQSGQHLGELPGVLLRYAWPGTATAPALSSQNHRGGRILVAWSAAGGAIPAPEHIDAIQTARARSHPFNPERDVLAHASLRRLSDALDAAAAPGAEPITALHLLCHGGPIGQTFGLTLNGEDEGDSAVVVDAGRLRAVLAPHAARVRLVVLAACDGANIGAAGNQLGSVAQAIHRAGIEVVVASRFPLSTAGSTRLTRIFYRELFEGGASYERAFLAARKKLLLNAERLDWAGIQFYARGAGGSVAAGASAAAGGPEGASAPGALATPARAARGPIVGLPESLESLFKGREHLLTELHRALRGQRDVALQSASPRAGHVAGHGGGGIGKTRLAIEYAWRHRDDYPGGIFFVVAARRDPLAIWAELARRAPQLFPGDLTRDEEAAVAFARWLSDPAQGAKLIVLDDVQAESSKELFVRFGKREVSGQGIWPIPAEAGVSVLITTRLRGVRGALEVEVTALDAEAARDLLVERSGRRRLSSEEETAALDLADRVLGGHPLALSLAGAYLRETGAGFSIASYRDKVARVGTMTALEEAASRAGYQVDDYERSILETYRLSRGLLLPTNSIDARALRLLSIASCLAANVPIDRRLLRRALADEGAADDEEVGLSTERLLKLSLLSPSRDEQSEEGDVIIHPLVADYTRVAIGEEEQKRVELAVVTTMTRLLPDHYMAMWKIAQKAHGDWEWLTSFREAHVDAVWRRSERYPTRWVGRLGAALGDLRVARGNLTSAREAFECSLAVREHLALQDAENAEWQRDLLVSHNRIGDVLMAQGQREEALSAYRAGLAIIECLAAQDAGNAQWQRDLSVSYDDIGDVLMAQRQKEEALSAYRAGLAIRERLAAQDAENAEWQRDLSVSYNKIADVFMVQGHRKEALWAYRVSLAIMERLVAQDAGNAQWQRDLSVGQNRIGDVLMARGQREEALSAYRAGLAISERLASQDAGNAQWQSDLAASCFRMGDALAGSSSDTCMEARTWLKRARRILMDLHATSRLAYQEQQWLLFIEQKLATLPP